VHAGRRAGPAERDDLSDLGEGWAQASRSTHEGKQPQGVCRVHGYPDAVRLGAGTIPRASYRRSALRLTPLLADTSPARIPSLMR
jgi:hypothetical protein